ncbi:hypothetical protein EF53_225 [Enterococcus phage 53]|uniref:Uncharacterized protein n=1 Tax=Enterococcus phage vB_Efs6_KEN16 TaxID=3138325 RepID=A0AAX4PRU6_9CAUD|nr:hypothetical protein EF53_225 [Enterococcus phage 53]
MVNAPLVSHSACRRLVGKRGSNPLTSITVKVRSRENVKSETLNSKRYY